MKNNHDSFNQFWQYMDTNGTVSKRCKELIWQMLSYEPDERPGIDDLLNDELLKAAMSDEEA